MNYDPKRFDHLIDETITSIRNLSTIKGGEYAVVSEDRLSNFRKQAGELGVPMELIWKVYAQKHWDSVSTYVADLVGGRERPRSEPISGRVDDLLVYLILFKAMCDERAELQEKYKWTQV